MAATLTAVLLSSEMNHTTMPIQVSYFPSQPAHVPDCLPLCSVCVCDVHLPGQQQFTHTHTHRHTHTHTYTHACVSGVQDNRAPQALEQQHPSLPSPPPSSPSPPFVPHTSQQLPDSAPATEPLPTQTPSTSPTSTAAPETHIRTPPHPASHPMLLPPPSLPSSHREAFSSSGPGNPRRVYVSMCVCVGCICMCVRVKVCVGVFLPTVPHCTLMALETQCVCVCECVCVWCVCVHACVLPTVSVFGCVCKTS